MARSCNNEILVMKKTYENWNENKLKHNLNLISFSKKFSQLNQNCYIILFLKKDLISFIVKLLNYFKLTEPKLP